MNRSWKHSLDQDRARLDEAIRFGEAGDFGQPIQEGWLLAWLKELRDMRVAKDKHDQKRLIESLTSFWGLTSDQAERVMADLLDGKQPEYEEGPCRSCGGRGRVEVFVRSTCFGQETRNDECSKCRGTGTDKERIRLPVPTP